MPTKMLANQEVEVNDEGFFVDATQWTEEMAPLIAEEVGVSTPLTEQHWTVLKYMREEYFENGTGPTVRKLGKSSGIGTKELFALFPKGPAKLAALCAGIPKPRGCI
jgi:TusE/DsrC/DsvC family sulfur relay protein